MTRETLRTQFQAETNTFPVVGARQPYSQHIEWLEDKIIQLNKAEILPISDVRNFYSGEDFKLKLTKLISRAIDDTRTVCSKENVFADSLNAILDNTTSEIIDLLNRGGG